MGAVIVRSCLERLSGKIALRQRGRVVPLAPQNRGSHVASMMPRWVGSLIPAAADLGEEGGGTM